jgi:hypothetical protein
MAYNQTNEYPQENTGVLFPKENLSGNPKAPSYTGTFTDINGKKWQLAAWTKTAKSSGQEFFTLKVSELRENNGGGSSYHNSPPRNLPPVYTPKVYAPMKSALDHAKDEDINF